MNFAALLPIILPFITKMLGNTSGNGISDMLSGLLKGKSGADLGNLVSDNSDLITQVLGALGGNNAAPGESNNSSNNSSNNDLLKEVIPLLQKDPIVIVDGKLVTADNKYSDIEIINRINDMEERLEELERTRK